jgi:hypothetical protein
MHTALLRSLRNPNASPGVTQCTAETFFSDCFLATTFTARAKSVARFHHVADAALSANSRPLRLGGGVSTWHHGRGTDAGRTSHIVAQAVSMLMKSSKAI